MLVMKAMTKFYSDQMVSSNPDITNSSQLTKADSQEVDSILVIRFNLINKIKFSNQLTWSLHYLEASQIEPLININLTFQHKLTHSPRISNLTNHTLATTSHLFKTKDTVKPSNHLQPITTKMISNSLRLREEVEKRDRRAVEANLMKMCHLQGLIMNG